MLRDPLLHFVLAGALLFGGYTLVRGRESPADAQPVMIGEGELRWLGETFAGQFRRDPTPDEMAALVDNLVTEELLAREARALGLDRDDTIVRRRLAQKLTFLVEDTGRVAEPTEAELRAFHDHGAARYRGPSRVTFQQVYFSPNRRADAADAARQALLPLGQVGPEGAVGVGDPLPLEPRYADETLDAVSRLFGPGFADALEGLPRGVWAGPVASGYGQHLVFVAAFAPGAPRPFDEIREEVKADWRQAREAEARAAYIATLRSKYGVIVVEPKASPKLAGGASK
ncbi:peptidylprolyl isomerase [Alsobacter sp. SYSU M60028]|uniref:Peptidylprolyl isomerase n=1 Tax=Alsobacter ponti TaxID=2962936 RepID=A0ABT1LHM2_9HYPH|nr:peptidylprolyl isomerase [Alsobacter ponti]MCP8941005.1 peptidylprolyl isomerase [Alsobacter ponti]